MTNKVEYVTNEAVKPNRQRFEWCGLDMTFWQKAESVGDVVKCSGITQKILQIAIVESAAGVLNERYELLR